jgi:predicted metalloendopeptidase
MRKGLIGAGLLALLGCAGAPTTTLVSGVELQYVDRTVRPQDDLYRHLNGKWLDSFQLPPDKASYGSLAFIDDATQDQLHSIVEALQQNARAGTANPAGGVDHQSGLGMPDRDYYLKDDAKLKDARAKYLAYTAKMMAMAGDAQAKTHAAAILDLKTALAQAQWTRVENRDPIKTYNKIGIADLPRLMPAYDWQRYVRGSEIAGKADSVIINQPSYFSSLDKLITATPLPVWKAYFKWHVLTAAAPYLS